MDTHSTNPLGDNNDGDDSDHDRDEVMMMMRSMKAEMKSCPCSEGTQVWGPRELIIFFKLADRSSVRTGDSSGTDNLEGRMLMFNKVMYASVTLNRIDEVLEPQ